MAISVGFPYWLQTLKNKIENQRSISMINILRRTMLRSVVATLAMLQIPLMERKHETN